MVLELHVWGPAFGLPSIDAECNAAIAYLNQALPQGQWVLIADHDASLSPTRTFINLFKHAQS
jgi:sorting and assembly machinery component 37